MDVTFYTNSRFLMTSERALTADLHTLVKAILTVVLPVTQPLFGNALVLWAGKLVPQAWGVCRGQWERNFNAINQTKWGGNNNKSAIPYRRGRVFLIKTQQVGWLLFAPWLACFTLQFFCWAARMSVAATQRTVNIYFLLLSDKRDTLMNATGFCAGKQKH